MALANFRAVAGLSSAYGGRLRPGRLFRAGQPTSPDDVPPPGVSLIVDLRYPAERRAGETWRGEGLTVMVHDVDRAGDSPQDVVKALAPRTIGQADAYYQGLYRDLPFDAAYRPLFARALHALAEDKGGVLIHCTQGKDRTGILMALILEIAGIDRADIKADFVLSGTTKDLGPAGPAILADFRRDYGYDADMDVLVRLMCIQPSYLDASYAAIEARCGTVDAYLDEVGVDAALRERLRGALLTG